MNAIEKIRAAQTAATTIIQGFVSAHEGTPDAIEARKAELLGMKKDELVELILGHEKPKNVGVKVEDVAKAILESPECACLTYDQIAGLVTGAFPDRNTSGKSIASYASKRKDEWSIVGREKVKLDIASIMAMTAPLDKAVGE